MFTPLNREEIGKIVHLQFANLQQQLADMGIQLSASDEALDWLAQLGYDPQYGARPLKRVIQKHILNELSKEILAGKIVKDAQVKLDMFDNKFVFLNQYPAVTAVVSYRLSVYRLSVYRLTAYRESGQPTAGS